MSSPHIFVDLDGVLVDFVQATCDLMAPGSAAKDVIEEGTRRYPDLHPFGRLEKMLGFHAARFWAKITDAGARFWAEADELPYAKELWEKLNEQYPGKVAILTSPGKGPTASTSAAGKYMWVHKHFGEEATYRTIVCPAPLKQRMAEGSLLIDDYDHNVKRWNNAGGIAYMWPSLQFTGRNAEWWDVSSVLDLAKEHVA